MTRLETGHLSPNMQIQDLGEIVQATLSELHHPARIQLALPEELSLVLADFSLLQQVLVNLLDNALKFNDGPVEIGATSEGKLWVRDWGSGIPEKERELLFQRFYRGSNGRKATGTGLGLSICRGLVQAMQGSITVEDAEPGARFVILLRTAPPVERPPSAQAGQETG